MRHLIKPHPLGRNMDKKNCAICGKEFEKDGRVSRKIWETQTKFCSRVCMGKSKIGNTYKTGISYPAWNKGTPQTEAVKEKLSKALKVIAKQKGFGKWMTGKKASLESRRKMSEAMKKRVAEGKHNFYIDGRTPINKAIRGSVEFKIWKDSVFRRDNYTCQECGARSGSTGKRVYLHAHHIKPFAHYPELRFDINNGQTLCKECHKKTDTFAWKGIKNDPLHGT